nr:hypothetical protein [Tanacetum cinerariifolium]
EYLVHFIPNTPKTSLGKRLKTTAKVTTSGKKKLQAQGLESLSEIALTDTELMKIVTKRSKIDFHSSQSSGSSADEGTGVSPGVPDVPIYGSEDKQKSSDDEDDDEVSLSKDDDNDAENDDGQDDDNEQTESENDVQQQSSSVYSGFISNMLNLNLDTGIDSILNMNTESTSLVDVLVTSYAKMPPSFAITLPPPLIPLIQSLQQTPFEDRVKALEDDFSEFKQTNRFVEAVSSIPSIVDTYLANKMNEAVKTAKSSHVVAANQSEIELKNILIDKMENTVTFKRRRDDEDEDEESFGGSNQGSKRKRARKEPESSSAPKEKTSKLTGNSKEGSKSHQKSTGKSSQAEELIHTADNLEELAPQDNLARKEDTIDSFNELMDTPLDFLAFMMNRLKVDTLTPELLARLTLELMKGSCKSLVELEYFFEEVYKETTDQLDWNNPRGRGGASSQTYATPVTKTKAADYGHIKWIEDLVSNTMWIPVPVNYDKHALWGFFHWGRKLRRDDEKLYTIKEGDYKRLYLQDIKYMMLLLVQCKLKNLTIEERLALNVSLRMFTRSIVIQRRVEDLQLGVESYQNKLNLTRPDTYRSDLKRLPTYSAYPNPRGFIYQNKDKKNKLMRINKLHKFSDGILSDVQTALNDILKRIRMKYLPQTYWRNVDKERAGDVIHAIDKQLKNRRIMRSLEKIIGGRPYEGDFRLLERTT